MLVKNQEKLLLTKVVKDSDIIEEKLSESFLSDAEELKKILASILKTSKGIA